MKVNYEIYLFVDSWGNKTFKVIEDSTKDINLSGVLMNQKFELVSFDSEAYHLGTFCEENKITMKILSREEDFDEIYKMN